MFISIVACFTMSILFGSSEELQPLFGQYSTKHSKQAIVLKVMRSPIVNIVILFALPVIFGSGIVRFGFGIYECVDDCNFATLHFSKE